MKNENKYFRLFEEYVRKGNKTRAKKHRDIAMEFLRMCETMGNPDLKQIGRRHVIQFWKRKRELTKEEAMEHWIALRELWNLSKKTGYPELPRQCEGMDVLSIPY